MYGSDAIIGMWTETMFCRKCKKSFKVANSAMRIQECNFSFPCPKCGEDMCSPAVLESLGIFEKIKNNKEGKHVKNTNRK